MIESAPVDYDKDEELNAKLMLSDVRQGTARSNAKSSQDGTNDKGYKFKVRYAYAPAKYDDESREFCKDMVDAGKIYRKEDIMAMSSEAVNPGWGRDGSDTYDIWLYKGGGSCRHFWERRVYMAKTVTPDAKNPRSEISVNQARREGFTPEVNEKKVAQRTRDQENRGFQEEKKFKTPKNKGFN